jgi:hypothetical protein
MPVSIPSKVFAIVDVPEVTTLDAEFRYNFFVPDEMVNDSGILPESFIKKQTATSFDSSLVDSVNFKRFVPRSIKITWTPVIAGSSTNLTDKITKNISIEKNLNRIYNETSFAADNYTPIQFQDTDQTSKSTYFVERLLQEVEGNDPNVKQQLKDLSLLDKAKKLNLVTSDKINPDILVDALSQPEQAGQFFVDKIGNQVTKARGILEETSEVGIKSQVNARLAHRVFKTSTESVTGYLTPETLTSLQMASQAQQQAIVEYPATLLTGRDYDFLISDIIDIEAVDTNGCKPEFASIGYIINKKEYTADDRIVEHHPIIIESSQVSTTTDLKIKYGSRYEYTIQTVVAVRMQADDFEEGEVVAVRFLVSSKPSFIRTIECVERVSPPPPSDFKVAWDYQKNMPRLTWSFPPNPQRDIKFFQVFRRASTSVPFELVKMFDFDNSVVPAPVYETPDPRLVEKVSSPKNLYLDSKFDNSTQKSEWIYTVACIDAHGFSSNYSTQFKVRFNRFSNKLESELVSKAGAPKAYPNMNLNVDTFVDSIRDSGHSKLKIVFNPEFYKVLDDKQRDLGLIKQKYRLQMINVDLQEQVVVNIHINDLTPSDKR